MEPANARRNKTKQIKTINTFRDHQHKPGQVLSIYVLSCFALFYICSSIECLLKLYVTGQLKTRTWSSQNCDLANSKSYLANARLYLAKFKTVTWPIKICYLSNSKLLLGQFKNPTRSIQNRYLVILGQRQIILGQTQLWPIQNSHLVNSKTDTWPMPNHTWPIQH